VDREPSLPAVVRVVIVEDDRRSRDGLAKLIDGTQGYACTGAFRSIEEAFASPWQQLPHAALMDIGLPGMSGIEGVRRLREEYPSVTPVMLTVFEDDERIFQALCAGARGYLLKKTPPTKLLESLREAILGGGPMSPEIARRVIERFHTAPAKRPDYSLTPHESRLLRMLVEGHTYGTAADGLGVSFTTVAFHMRNIYQKLQVHSKSEAVAKALRQRLVP
jgi:DNA-binding NarL/FixJ family response regulator